MVISEEPNQRWFLSAVHNFAWDNCDGLLTPPISLPSKIITIIIRQIRNPHHCVVGAHQHRGKMNEKSEEEERNRRTEDETSYFNPANWHAHKGRTELEKEKNRERVYIYLAYRKAKEPENRDAFLKL